MTGDCTLPRGVIATVKTTGGKDAHATISLHVPLDGAFGRIAAFLAACQELSCTVSVTMEVVELEERLPR